MPRYTREELEKFDEKRKDARRIKDEIMQLIYPNREYLCYFIEYFPDFNTKSGRGRIKACWNGITCSEDIVKMMKHVLEKIKSKQHK